LSFFYELDASLALHDEIWFALTNISICFCF